MNNRRNHYRMLYVQPPDASFEVIRANYRTLMRKLKLHPDLGGDHWNAVYLNAAYATVGDPVRRAAYDLELLKRYGIATLSRGPLRVTNRPHGRSKALAGDQRNLYRILQVQADAPLELIEASYRTLSTRSPTPGPLANAFATLRDPVRRRRYDRDLEAGEEPVLVARTAVGRGPVTGGQPSRPQGAPPARAGYEPVITRYCLFCKTPHASIPSVLEEAGCTECGSPLFAPPADFLDQARRSLGRSLLSEDLAFYTFWPGERLAGRMLDLSPTGMRLLTPEVCDLGDIIKIDAHRLQAVGEIAHQHRDRSATTAGVKFHTVGFHETRGSFLSARA